MKTISGILFSPRTFVCRIESFHRMNTYFSACCPRQSLPRPRWWPATIMPILTGSRPAFNGFMWQAVPMVSVLTACDGTAPLHRRLSVGPKTRLICYRHSKNRVKALLTFIKTDWSCAMTKKPSLRRPSIPPKSDERWEIIFASFTFLPTPAFSL